MAQPSAFTWGITFALGRRITFNTLDFLATATGELSLACPNAPSTTGSGSECLARTKSEKQRLKRRATALKQCLNQLVAA
jgi:hypothetical protein